MGIHISQPDMAKGTDQLIEKMNLGQPLSKDDYELARTLLSRLYQTKSTKNDSYEPGYPMNLISAIYGHTILKATNMTDLNSKVEDMLNTLDERPRNILKMRFKNGSSLDDTGRVYNISREYVRQIETEAIKMLQHPSRLSILTGKSDLYALATEAGETYRMELKRYTVKTRAIREKIGILSDALTKVGVNSDIEDIMSIPLDDIKEAIGMRAYNVLKQEGIEKAGDICARTESSIAALPHMGRQSMDNIIEWLDSHGLKFLNEKTGK